MLLNGNRLLLMSWLPRGAMVHGNSSPGPRIILSLDPSGSLSKSIMLMALLNTTQLIWSLRVSINVLDSSILKYSLSQCVCPLFTLSLLSLSFMTYIDLWSVDISYTYLNGKIDCEVYIEQPEGFAEGDPKHLSAC